MNMDKNQSSTVTSIRNNAEVSLPLTDKDREVFTNELVSQYENQYGDISSSELKDIREFIEVIAEHVNETAIDKPNARMEYEVYLNDTR